MNNIYALYDTKSSNNRCVGVFDDGKEVAEFIGIDRQSVYCAISRNLRLESRYEVVKINIEEGQ